MERSKLETEKLQKIAGIQMSTDEARPGLNPKVAAVDALGALAIGAAGINNANTYDKPITSDSLSNTSGKPDGQDQNVTKGNH